VLITGNIVLSRSLVKLIKRTNTKRIKNTTQNSH